MQNRVGRVSAAGVLLSVSILGLAACGDGGSAALAARDHAAPGDPPSSRSYEGGESRVAANDVSLTSAPIRVSRPRAEGESDIAWASSRRASGSDNAQARFEKYGAEFQTASAEAYAAKARAFIKSPPSGAQTIERANGDRLVYDPKANVFAVANEEGLPRTFFHPRDGAAYWSEQKATESKRTASARSSSRNSDG